MDPLAELANVLPADRVVSGGEDVERHAGGIFTYHAPVRPDAVVYPQSRDEVVEILRFANSLEPVLPGGVQELTLLGGSAQLEHIDRWLAERTGIPPARLAGHSLGEYGALVAAGALSFAAALEAVSARGSEMAHLTVEDNGAMAAVIAPLDEIERIVASIDGYVVIPNANSTRQAAIGGATAAADAAIHAFSVAGPPAL